MGGERVTERVAGNSLVDACPTRSCFDGFLERTAAGMVTAMHAGPRIGGDSPGGEHILPDPLASGARVLAFESFGEVDGPKPGGQVLLVAMSHLTDMVREGFHEAMGQDGEAVLASLAISHDDLAQAEVDVLDAQANAFREAETASVEELAHEPMLGQETDDEVGDLVLGENGGEPLGPPGADGVNRFVERFVQDELVEEQKGVEGLVLGSGSDFAVDGEVGEEGADVSGAQVSGMASTVEQDEAADPTEVADLGAKGVVLAAEDESSLIEDSRLEGAHG